MSAQANHISPPSPSPGTPGEGRGEGLPLLLPCSTAPPLSGPRSPAPATILGVGAVTPLGRDLPSITLQLRQPPPAPAGPLRVNDDLISDPAMTRRMRRADRFGRMAAAAALDAWAHCADSCAAIPPERLAFIMSSGFGPHVRGFKFLDGILEHGDSAALPTDFSHSVHGAAAAYISAMLELRGPSMAATDFELGVEQAVLLAQCWLAQGACDRVLVGAAEEIGQVMLHCAARMISPDQHLTPGEGAVFLLLAPGDLPGLAHIDATAHPRSVDLLLLDDPPRAPGLAPDIRARHTASCTPYFGHSASSSAFHLLGAFLALTSPPGLAAPLAGRSPPASDPAPSLDNAATYRPSFTAPAQTLLLQR